MPHTGSSQKNYGVFVSRLRETFEPWVFAACLIVLSPVVHTIMTWDNDGKLTNGAFAIRHYSLPVIILELGVIWIAAKAGFQPTKSFMQLGKPVQCMLATWFMVALISACNRTDQLALSIIITARYAIHVFVLAATVFLIKVSDTFESALWIRALTIGACCHLLALVLFIALVPSPDSFPWVYRLPSATNVRQIGNNLSLLAIAPIAGLLVRDSGNKGWYFLAVALITAFVAWTGTRGGLLGLALGTCFAIMATPRFTTLRNLGMLIASCTTGLLISMAAFHPAPQFGLFRMVATISTDDASSGRVLMWINTLTEIATSPFFGSGSGRFRENMLKYGFENNHPHNFVLQYIYDWGIIGGAAALIALTWLGLRLFQFKNQVSTIRFLSLAGFTGTLSIAMIEGTLFHPLPMLIGSALIAPALGLVKKKHDE